MQIHGLQKLTLLDFPGHIACTVFTGGCNFRCPFCHNAGLVLAPEKAPLIPEDEFFAFLESRKGRLEGVAITGGEPTIQKDLPEFIRAVRAKGFAVKLDSNGQNPDMLEALLKEGLLNYVAMDIKNSRERYGETIGLPGFQTDKVERSVKLLMESGIDYEFRTTLMAELHDDASMEAIGQWIQGCKAYYLQSYRDSDEILAPGRYSAPDKQTVERFREILLPYVPSVSIRGID
ncbi:MAG: anaerobic ribonucleoside-triphosphate reductase activating protein [Lachnospiraceae bacterium]|nr:anaerobic ribonucleoside-triphosphate reductase activating protein [Lachnospiraceae bacterium]